MSVIIRLQNLPWSANALDIRQFFKGLSIPEGGVHIVGGEMGDAFIAFSTDEDARQGMMRDREAINGVQVRLLLSSRAEMQKVIETARQLSLIALKNANLVPAAKVTPPAPAVVVTKTVVPTPQPPVISASSFHNILSNPLAATPSFLAYQQQAGITLIPDPSISTKKNSNDSDDSETRHSRERRRSGSRERRRSRSRSRERNSMLRRRRERSRERSKDRDRHSGRRSSRRSHSRERSRAYSRDHSRDRSRERSRNSRDNSRRGSRDNNSRPARDVENKLKSNTSSWNITNAYQANYNSLDSTSKTMSITNTQQITKFSGYQGNYNSLDSAPKSMNQFNNRLSDQMGSNKNSMPAVGKLSDSSVAAATVSLTAVATTFQNYNTINPSLTALNNYSLSSLLSSSTSNDSYKGFALQNPYTTALNAKTTNVESAGTVTTTTTTTSAIPGIFVEQKSDPIAAIPTSNPEKAVVNALQQEPIAFSTVNPYEQMYPNLFAQAAALGSGQKPSPQPTKQSTRSSPKANDSEMIESNEVDPNETSCVKISNMCSRTTYSDLRKFFVGLFIPHNGIKMLNDKHGLRVGIAYVQFSRQSSVAKALCRNNKILKWKSVIVEAVAEKEFEEAEDSYRPNNHDKQYHSDGRDNDSDQENTDNADTGEYSALNPFKKIITTEPFSVLYIEDIPALATEQDIIKMFSSYSLYDILLLPSPENRREFVAHARFSREEDAKSAYEDKAHHQIGYRRLRIRPGSIEDMDNAKEKIRLANEQLMKEEQAAKIAAEEEETKRKLEKLITEQITIVEEKEKQQQKELMLQQKQKQQHIESMDLTQEDAEDDDVIETTDELKNENYDIELGEEDDNDDYGDDDMELAPNDENVSGQYNNRNINSNFSKDPRRIGPNNSNNSNNKKIPSLLDLDPMNSNLNSRSGARNATFNDPRLRNDNTNEAGSAVAPNNNNAMMGGNNLNNFNPSFNSQQTNPPIVNSIECNFVILKNCDYNTRIHDVAQLLITANLGLKHIEPLHNERQLPTGEFIVEFRRTQDAETAIQQFHNTQFRNRSLRVFPISPQEIADRLAKPFLGYIPGGNGQKLDSIARNNINNLMNNNNMNSLMNSSRMNFRMNAQRAPLVGPSFRDVDNVMPRSNIPNRFGPGGNLMSNNSLNDSNDAPSPNMNNDGECDDDDNTNNSTNSGMPEKFQQPGCVLALENVPYKAQVSDILRFFQGFNVMADDIIRRFNDDGSPTGDARVAFDTPDIARAAFEAKKRKHIFGRTIFINIL